MYNRTISLTLFSSLMLGGCAMGPDYLRPDVIVPETFSQSDSNVTKKETINTQWWKNFKDPSLDHAIKEALLANYDLQASRASVDAMLGQFDQAEAALYPQINGSTSLNRKEVSNATNGGYQLKEGVTSTYAASLSLASYEIDLFGKVKRANEAARSALLSSEYAAQTVKLTITSGVAASYIKLSSLQRQIELARENVALSHEIYELNRLKFKYGAIAETSLLQSRSEVENAKATLSALEAAKIAEEATYNLLLGRNPSAVIVSSLESLTIPNIPTALPSSVLTQRPDIASAEQNLISANARIGIARAAYFPSIKLTGMLGIQSVELSNFLSNPARLFELTPSITVPIFSAGRIDGEIKSAEANKDQSLAAYKKTIISAFNDTQNALGQTTKAKEQMNYQIQRLEAIQKALTQSKLRYQVGTITYSDMLLIQQQWLQASQQLIIARQNNLISMISLYKSLGGGWENNSSYSS